jgi:hypothetical protein
LILFHFHGIGTLGQELEIEFMLEEDITLVVTTDTTDQLVTIIHMDITLTTILIVLTDIQQDVLLLDTLTEDTTEQVTTLAG